MNFKKYVAGALLGISSFGFSQDISSYSDKVKTTTLSNIVYLYDGQLTLNGKTPDYAITLGYKNSSGEWAGFLDSAYNSGHPSGGAGLWYKSDGSGRGFSEGETYSLAEARVDLNRNGLFSEDEIADYVDDGGFRPYYMNEDLNIFPTNVEKVFEPASGVGGLAGFLSWLGFRRRKRVKGKV